MKKITKRTVLISLAIFIAVVLLGGYFFLKKTEKDLDSLVTLEIATPELSEIPDGIYPGDFSSFPITVKVEVTVADHKIEAIKIVEHINGQGAPAEVIIDEVVKENSIQVDVISGATYSSVVILKAIEDALVSWR